MTEEEKKKEEALKKLQESFMKARKKRGNNMEYMWDPPLNVIVADMYWKDTSHAWIQVAKFYYTLMTQKKAQNLSKQVGKDIYFWVSYNLVVSRLWHYGIRNKCTVSRALELLCHPTDGLPPLLKRMDTHTSNGRLRLYYAKTEVFDDLFRKSVDHEFYILNEQAYQIDEDDDDCSDDLFDDDSTPPDFLAMIKEPAKQETPEAKEFILPEWWDKFWKEVSATGNYKDNIYKDKEETMVNGYVQKAVNTISSILDGTYYNKGFYGEHHDVKYDLSGVTIDIIIDAMKKYKVKDPCTMDDVVCTYPGRGNVSRKSGFISLVCIGEQWPKDKSPSSKHITQKIKPSSREEIKTFFKSRVRVPETLDFIWNESSSPAKYYPELVEDSPLYWGIYFKVAEEHDSNYYVDKDNPEKSGLWSRNNPLKGIVSVQTLVNTILVCAKSAGFTFEELMSYLVVGKDDNYIWALTMQWVYNNKSEVRLGNHLTENAAKFIYSTMKLIPNGFYTGVPDRLRVKDKKVG